MTSQKISRGKNIFHLFAKQFYLIACSRTNRVHFSQFPTGIFRPIAEVVRKRLIHWRSLLFDKPPYFRPAKRYSCHGTDEIATIFYPMDRTWLPFVMNSFVLFVFVFMWLLFASIATYSAQKPIWIEAKKTNNTQKKKITLTRNRSTKFHILLFWLRR